MRVIGHRGAAGHAPENTLESVELAIAMGADGIEIDVQMVDGELILFHDASLERTTNGTGLLQEAAFEHLRALDAGNGARIPTLQELLDCVDARVFVNIELKGVNIAQPVSEAVRSAISVNPDWRERILLSSFDEKQTQELSVMDRTGWYLGVLFEDSPAQALERANTFKAYSIHPSRQQVDEKFLSRAHHLGLKVFVYTVNEADDIERMQRLGVDGVFSDYPDAVIRSVSPYNRTRIQDKAQD